MSDEPTPIPTEPPPAPPPAAKSDEDPQVEQSRVFGKIRSEGKKTGRKELLAERGFDSEEALDAELAESRARKEAEKTEAERARDAAAEAQARAEAAEQAAQAADYSLRRDRALIAAGVPAESMAYAAKLVEADTADDDEALATAVAQLVEDFPALLAAPDGGSTRSPDWTPKGGTREKKPPTGKSALEQGRERFLARKGR